MNSVDRFLYRLGIVRRSVFNDLRYAAEAMLDEYDQYKNDVYDWQSKTLNVDQEQSMPKPPKFKLIQGGKS